MGTAKRERQKSARLEKTVAEAAAAKREKSKRTAIRIVLAAIVILVVLFGITTLMGNDSDDSDDAETVDTTAPADADAGDEPGPDGIDGSDGSGEFAYGSTPCPPEPAADSATLTFDDSFEQCIDPDSTYTATFATSEGDVVVELDTTDTPGTTNNFVALSRHLYYDGTELFRTDPSIGIIQGGSPHSNDPSDEGPGYAVPDEGGVFDFSDGQGSGPFTYAPGELIMARSAGPDGGSAQFFFSVDENVTALDSQGTYVRFGTVTEGLDVLESIMALHEDDPTSPLGGGPSRPVTVESVTITES